jgi:5-methylcytosine-specific restriction enzyme A
LTFTGANPKCVVNPQMATYPFKAHNQYARHDVLKTLGLPETARGGKYYTGLFEHNGAHFIFCNVGSPGRTGHDYGNKFIGDRLSWSGRTDSKKTQPKIQELISGRDEVYIFFRNDDRADFTFAGLGKAVEVSDRVPVRILWDLSTDPETHPEILPEEVTISEPHFEGAVRQVMVNLFERDPNARKACLAHYGYKCRCCDASLVEFYGDIAREFIHVHHLVPLSDIKTEYSIDPIKDLVPVCPNCHAMLHRRRPPYTIE